MGLLTKSVLYCSSNFLANLKSDKRCLKGWECGNRKIQSMDVENYFCKIAVCVKQRLTFIWGT